MIRKGDVIENPVTGERMHFLQTSAETNGEAVVLELTARPDAFVAAAHVHPFQQERFEILSGTLGAKLGRRKLEAKAGEVVVIEPGTPHRWWNAGEDELRFRVEVKPALQFERLIETMFSLAADGKTNRKGMPNPLRLAVIAKAHFDDVRLPFPPAALQKLGLALGAPVGRMLGYGAAYEPAAGVPAPVDA